MQIITGRFIKVFFVLSITLFLSFPSQVLSQTKDQNTAPQETEQTSPLVQSIIIDTPVPGKKIDEAGEKIGTGIEKFGENASSHIGEWINAKAFAGITWLKLVVCLFLLFLVVLIERILKFIIQKKKRSIPQEEDIISWTKFLLEAIEKPLSLVIWIYGIYIALSPLLAHFKASDGTNLVHSVAQRIADIGGMLAIIWLAFRLVQIVDIKLKKWTASTESAIDDMLGSLVGKTLRIFIIIIGGMIVIQNLTGLQLGPLIASLGIGGLAVALAAKESIANFFGTLTILFDKPFQVGERIVIDNCDGVVESVGFRSTRIRTLKGHLVTIPNEKVVNSALENIGRRPHIRWLTNITITYDTPPDKVEKAVKIIENILDNHEGMNKDFPPRVYFNNFNDCSLNIMVIVWYHPPDYWDCQAWIQKTCLEIMREFEKEEIEFAFPTQTVYLANDEKRQLKLQLLSGENIQKV
ncbi:MAG: mechanosensitive ion channel family protein [Proteobacteria bacterium]|nr:mechanosensitive ion channel family protein [Pseudomonadota bacterium]